jgi:hypothetical protein
MYNINEFCAKLSSSELIGNEKIFTHSDYKNAYKPLVIESVVQLIDGTIPNKNEFMAMDICCGHGFMLRSLKMDFNNSKLIGIDIDKFDTWTNDIDNLAFYSADMFKMIQLDLDFKFDIIFTFNTLRGSIEQWGYDNFNNFLQWCSKYSKYMITNNCTNKSLNGFELINTIPVHGDFDTNLFKSIQ